MLPTVPGTTDRRIDALLTLLSDNPMILIAVGLLLVGFGFKISAVPFHMWTPDAYEGAPAIVTGFMSTGVKVAAFAAFTRVFLSTFEPFITDWAPLVAVLAAATMILGTVVGVAQTNIKRMLAYSSIAHGGYLLVALVSANPIGKGAVLFYLLTYAVTNIGAFGVATVAAMTGFAALLGSIASHAPDAERAHRVLMTAAALLAIVVGGVWLTASPV